MCTNVDNTKQLTQLNCISFFSGIRGIERGLSLAGVPHKTVTYVEIEAVAIANLVEEMETGDLDSAPIFSDIKTFRSDIFRDKIHLFTGGYPCQPFSVAGSRKGNTDPRHLFPYLLQHIKSVRPICLFLENVPGHLKLGYDQVYRDLRNLGYQVEAGLFSSAQANGSHKRQRLFILGILADTTSRDERWKTSEGFATFIDQKSSRILERRQQMEYTSSNRSGKRKHQDSKRQRSWTERSNSDVVYVPSQRTSEMVTGENAELFDITSKRIPIAKQGIYQYHWEPKRQCTADWLKSSLGLSIADGYDFRTDFLRALGNSVDPFTAAIAWKTLIKKFI